MQERETYLKTYQNFQGVDFTTNPAQVDDAHSPLCENIVADYAGYPEKRLGWRKLCEVLSPVNGLYYVVFESGAAHKIVHGGTKLYTWDDDTPVELYTSMNDAKSVGFAHNGKLYLLDGANYLCLYEDSDNDGALTVDLVTNMDMHIPTTCIARVPEGVSTDPDVTPSTPYEEINLLTPQAKNSFAGVTNALVYVLDTKGITSVDKIEVNGAEVTSGFTVNLANSGYYGYPTVTFSSAPGPSTEGAGLDNIIITFSKSVEGNAEKITKCTIAAEYGYYNDNRFFFAGNPDNPNTDWCSGVDDPTYWPEYGYTKVGASTNPIMGYIKQGDALVILKADNEQDAEIFLRTATQDTSDGTITFPVKQGIKGIGAIAKGGIANMVTDALFLAKEGVFSVETATATNERRAVNKSYYVNAKLTEEDDLEDAEMCSWDGLLLLSVNNYCYVADNRQGEFNWYYWTNVPARVFMTLADVLYFGTPDGRICRFNNDIEKMDRYSDGGTLADGQIQDGIAISAKWATKADALEYLTKKKTMLKKGSGVMIKPYIRSSVKVYAETDRMVKTLIKQENMDILDFSDLDFTRFTFNGLDGPKTVAFNKQIKKFITIQLFFENDSINEGFGVYGIQIQYVLGQYAK